MTSYNHDLWCTIDTNEVVTIVQKYNVQRNANEKFSWDVILIYLGTIEVTWARNVVRFMTQIFYVKSCQIDIFVFLTKS